VKPGGEQSVQFEAVVGENGSISLPPEFLKSSGEWIGKRAHVRLTTVELARELRARNVEESEVRAIAALQLESRDRVVRFLLTEGALGAAALRKKGRKR
jgi:hypothetical protein